MVHGFCALTFCRQSILFYLVAVHNLRGAFICSFTANNGSEWRRARGAKVNCCGWSPTHREWLDVWLVNKSACGHAAIVVQFSPVFCYRFYRFRTLPTISVTLFWHMINVKNIACIHKKGHNNSYFGKSANLLQGVGNGPHSFGSSFPTLQFSQNTSSSTQYSSKRIWPISTIQSFFESKFSLLKKGYFCFLIKGFFHNEK